MELLRLFAMLLAITCMIVSLLGLGGAFANALDIFNHFAPIVLALSIVAVSIQLAFGETMEKPTLVFALIGVIVSAGVMAPELAAVVGQRRAAPLRQTLKIVQMNLWSENVAPAATATWLAAQQADVLVLEEVVGNALNIPRLLKRTYPYQTRCDPDVPCTTLILSRRRPVSSGVYPAPDPDGLHSSAWATFGAGPDAFAVVGTHAPWPRPRDEQQGQSALLASRLSEFHRPSLIVAGDFNSTPWSFSLRRQDAMFGLQRRTRALFSFPVRKYSKYKINSPVPLLPIDHIYAGADWKSVRVSRGPRLGSDHLPMVAVLTR